MVCWIAQFIGHGVYEKRRPKLFDNLIQALSLAVLFVWLEFLFYFGYRKDLAKRLQNKVGVEITRLKQQEKNLSKSQPLAKKGRVPE